ncbi:MAG: polysaccharide biosynthesis protein [Muribaculaceae bacterium]|nr:polysaccharide biosynthesis protein [Muribaculaceae bacterium]
MDLFNRIVGIFKHKFLHKWAVFIIDVMASFIASLFVILLVRILHIPYDFSNLQLGLWFGGSILFSAFIFRIGTVYRAIIRYSSLRELNQVSIICIAKDFLLWLVMGLLTPLTLMSQLLAAMVIMDFFITVCMLIMVRVLVIVTFGYIRHRVEDEEKIRRVLVYGTSEKSLSAMMRLTDSTTYRIDGFIDYNKRGKSGIRIDGKNLYYFRNADDVKRIIISSSVNGILFANVADARNEQDRLIQYCREAGLRTYIVPDIDEIKDGSIIGNKIRSINIEDLLGRDEIKISMKEITENFSDKVVMVTGAAGSIGSELCRQLATLGVKKIVLFDNAETPLHNIRLELDDRFPDLDFVAVIGDVRSEQRLDYVFRQYRPQIVFHAAAYKHVPLMEENPCEAVCVNVNGTRNVADKCVEYGIEQMVMVSTDKAVNPTNIMGCTKRLAEIYVQSLGLAIERGDIKGTTRFVTTRFGNVLGSNGSVIPRFREQLEHGGPITVTHPEITRFFMTIPEACRLVMEAATFATGTQIFVFDMGKSVKIVTLAERMIQLAGLEVGKDIKIEFTGLRPGEKLYEEVLATKENTVPTCHERIFIAKVRDYSYDAAADTVTRLSHLAISVKIPEMVILMKETVPEFISKNSVYEKYDKA